MEISFGGSDVSGASAVLDEWLNGTGGPDSAVRAYRLLWIAEDRRFVPLLCYAPETLPDEVTIADENGNLIETGPWVSFVLSVVEEIEADRRYSLSPVSEEDVSAKELRASLNGLMNHIWKKRQVTANRNRTRISDELTRIYSDFKEYPEIRDLYASKDTLLEPFKAESTTIDAVSTASNRLIKEVEKASTAIRGETGGVSSNWWNVQRELRTLLKVIKEYIEDQEVRITHNT